MTIVSQKKSICFFSEMFVCLPIREEQPPMVTAGDLSLQFGSFSLSNSAGKSDRDGKRIKKVMPVSKHRIVTAKKENWGLFGHAVGVAFYW